MPVSQPLSGLKIVVTRAAHQSSVFTDKLTELGAQVYLLPLISIAPPADWGPVDTAITNINQYDWIVFASVNAVDCFIERLRARNGGTSLGPASLAAIGQVTANRLQELGHHIHYQPSEFIAESFTIEFPEKEKLAGKKILWPKANIGRTLIKDTLEASGARVDAPIVYQTILPKPIESVAEDFCRLATQGFDIVTVASAQTARNLAAVYREACKDPACTSVFRQSKLIAIGPETEKALRQDLPEMQTLSAETFTTDGIIQAILKLQVNER